MTSRLPGEKQKGRHVPTFHFSTDPNMTQNNGRGVPSATTGDAQTRGTGEFARSDRDPARSVLREPDIPITSAPCGPSAPTPIDPDFIRPNKNVEIAAGRDTRALVEADARIPEEFVGNNAMTTSEGLVKPMGGAKISKQQVRDAVEVRTTATPRLLVSRIPHKSRLTRTPTRSRSLRS